MPTITKQPRKAAPPTPVTSAPNAVRAVKPASSLDRLADWQLQQGFHAAAERLSWLAAELREAAQ